MSNITKIVIIGGGLIGTLTARELLKWNIQVTLIESATEVGQGISKANSGIIHAGYDDEPGTLRAQFCVPGNKAYTQLAQELDIDVKRVGSHVVAFNREQLNLLDELLARGKVHGIEGLRILSQAELLDKEPHLNPLAMGSLWAPTAGVTEPWQVCLAAVENALANDLDLRLGETVTGFVQEKGHVKKVLTNRGEYECDGVLNAAGLYADHIATLVGDEGIPLSPRRGQYILLNKFTAHDLVKSILFPAPGPKGKGILVTPTVDHGILLGPTAEDLPRSLKDDRATTEDGLAQVAAGARILVPELDLREAVKVFSGSRPESPGKDFWLGPSKRIRGLVHAGAMRSPGLTAAPALAVYLTQVFKDLLGENWEKKSDFNPIRKRIPSYLRDFSRERLHELIQTDPAAGRVVCVCNKVTEKEVVEAIHRGARTLDGIKFRTRALFGECQGGFCTHKLLEILAREAGLKPEEIQAGIPGSWEVDGKVRP